MNKVCHLMLEDGFSLEGQTVYWDGTVFGEVVFTTNMTGYQEVMTDPSYAGQIVTFTYPLIGNYGALDEENESYQPHVRGIIVDSFTEGAIPGFTPLLEYVKKHQIAVMQDVDTRALTRHIRTKGAMKGGFSSVIEGDALLQEVRKQPDISQVDYVKQVSVKEPQILGEGKSLIVLIDYGVKRSILKNLIQTGFRVVVLPATVLASQVLEYQPKGVVLSNGPGDPAILTYAIQMVKDLMGKLPIFGICLGHQILALASNARTYKLKFGHHGGNHPVIQVDTGEVTITTQNHGFAVEQESLKNTGFRVSHRAVNDGTVEGMEHTELPIFSVQYHPEGAPGPLDSRNLFRYFLDMVEKF